MTTASSATARRSFVVDYVIPASTLFSTQTLKEYLNQSFLRELWAVPQANKAVINPQMDEIVREERRSLKRFSGGCHALVGAVHIAFSQHYPLTLSPDSIWLAIAQGFSHHITGNTSRFRKRLVRHAGRTKLTTTILAVNSGEIAGGIEDLSAQIRNASDPVLYETLVCDFSTTTPTVRTASQIVLMDTYSDYFEYEMMCICGIPQITLTGTAEDWQRIRDRVEVLATYDLEWWVRRLRPILDEFVRTAMGRPNRQFWQAIYKPRTAYGTKTVTGWLADLFPYLDDAPDRHRNHIFDYERVDWSIPVSKGVKTTARLFSEGEKGVAPRSFPSGLSSVPFKLTYLDGSSRDSDLVGGYFAIEQLPEDRSLSPVISWAASEPAPKEPVRIRQRSRIPGWE